MDIIKSILLGIIEGITEWLPISSTGHLILANEFIQLNASDAFMEMFDVVIQLGAILAVVVIYFPRLWPFCASREKHFIKKDTWSMWFKVLVASVPAMVVGLPLNDWLDEHFYNPIVVAITLALYGVLFILVENWYNPRRAKTATIDDMSYRTAFIIGMWQVLALIPGTSRSGATIVGALLLGCTRTVAAEFTFFLAIPAMFGASFLKLLKFGLAFTSTELVILLVGMVTAFIVSLLAIKFLVGYIKKHDFRVFGWYRIALAAVVLLYFFVIK